MRYFTFIFVIFFGIQMVRVSGWEIDQTAQVTSVTDGDTFRIPNDKVRLADINTPENGTGPEFTIAKYALAHIIGGKTVYIDTDQQSGRDQYGRLVAVVYVKYNSTHYLNVNKALLDQGVAVEMDYTNNEFSPASWTLYIKYANATSQIITGPRGPQGIQGAQGPPGDSSPVALFYISIVISAVSLLIAVIALASSRKH
jgi:hypothetical protein